MIRRIKKIVKRVPLFGDGLRLFYNRFLRRKEEFYDPPSKWFERLLTEKNIRVVQIGSNDGRSGDPLYDLILMNPGWTALFVEPIPYLFDRLKKNYGSSPRFSFANVAINNGSQQIFYSVKEEAKIAIPHLPPTYDQLGSFDKNNIIKHLEGVLEPFIEETLLSGIKLEELFLKYEIKEIDVLHIDTEGYDWKILSQLDLNKIIPKIILFEHIHLANSEKKEAINFLKEKYAIIRLGSDYLCLLRNCFEVSLLNNLKGVFIK